MISDGSCFLREDQPAYLLLLGENIRKKIESEQDDGEADSNVEKGRAEKFHTESFVYLSGIHTAAEHSKVGKRVGNACGEEEI